MKKNIYLFLIGAPLFALLLVGLRVYYSMNIWQTSEADTVFIIQPNENFASINSRLSKAKLISSPRLFHRYSQYKGVMNKFRSGEYLIKGHSNMLAVFHTLLNERSKSRYFTVPEGKNIFEIGKMLEERSITTYEEFISKARDPLLVKQLGLKGKSVEGYLYPESYDFPKNSSASVVIKTMVNHFKKKTSGLNFKSNNLPNNLSKEEVIVLASMVEKETGDTSERPTIAGVFHNRLKIKMRLQSDPTTIYGMFERYQGNITRKDLLTPSDYNTYTLPRLPKGPISNPGLESIKAVLNPEDHNYLYFVSQNDGTHIFSKDYKDHQNAVIKWQKTAKNREGKSWRNKKE